MKTKKKEISEAELKAKKEKRANFQKAVVVGVISGIVVSAIEAGLDIFLKGRRR